MCCNIGRRNSGFMGRRIIRRQHFVDSKYAHRRGNDRIQRNGFPCHFARWIDHFLGWFAIRRKHYENLKSTADAAKRPHISSLVCIIDPTRVQSAFRHLHISSCPIHPFWEIKNQLSTINIGTFRSFKTVNEKEMYRALSAAFTFTLHLSLEVIRLSQLYHHYPQSVMVLMIIRPFSLYSLCGLLLSMKETIEKQIFPTTKMISVITNNGSRF